VRLRDSKRLSLFHRLGILLVILGTMQSLVPIGLWLTRPSLRVSGPMRVALAALDESDPPARGLPSNPSLVTEPRQEEETDQESHDTENPAESMVWPEALAEHRSVVRSISPSPLCSLPRPGRGAERTRSSLQRTRTLPILSNAASSVTTRLCRFLC
jgi:hypothetical protein